MFSKICCCSDFRYESNGIFVLGVGFFFLQTNFDFLTSLFWRIFFVSFEKYCSPESYEGLKIAILTNLGQLTRNIIRAINA